MRIFFMTFLFYNVCNYKISEFLLTLRTDHKIFIMILIAPDKFKGTLTARQAASIIAKGLHPAFCLMAPMADGGEGTASIIGANSPWQQRNGYYVNPISKVAVIDSSAVIGLQPHNDVMHCSSAPLGLKVREILKGGCETVVIGVGGTGTCDGGEGFLQALDKYAIYKDKIIGLCDVQVPLLPPDSSKWRECPSALMFAPQKGATENDIELLYQRLDQVRDAYSHGKSSPFDGAGGGLGFAIATAIGAKCYPGAEYVFQNYSIDWDKVSLVITGEGCVDAQTSQGKVADVVCRRAHDHGKPCVMIGGMVKERYEMADLLISTADFMPDMPLNEATAAKRLAAAVEYLKVWLIEHPVG